MDTLMDRALRIKQGGFDWLNDKDELMKMGLAIADVVRHHPTMIAEDVGEVLSMLANKAGWELDSRSRWLVAMYGRLCYEHFEVLQKNIEENA
jgi:hypothetical protein